MGEKTPRAMDRRELKTRRALQNALMELMRVKPLEKITVTELTVTADINRKTFYNHYASVHDLLRELDDQYIDILFSFLEDASAGSTTEDLSLFIHQLVQAMSRDPVRSRLLFESGEYLKLIQRLGQVLLPYMEQVARKRQLSPSRVNLTVDYIVYGTLSVLNAWVTGKTATNSTEVEQMLASLIQYTLSPYGESGTVPAIQRDPSGGIELK